MNKVTLISLEVLEVFGIILFGLWVSFVSCSSSVPLERSDNVSNILQRHARIHTIVLIGHVNETDTRYVNDTVEYVYQFTFDNSIISKQYNADIRVHVMCDENADPDYPMMFVVRQQKGVLSWQLPIRSKYDSNKTYHEGSRTLCSDARDTAPITNNQGEKTIFVSVSTSNPKNVFFNISVSVEYNFVVALDQESIIEVSPPSPRFYQFIFPPSNSRFVLLEVTSNDTNCMTVSVQKASCPVLDQENNVQFEGYWQTMTTKAGMTLRKEDFPYGFYVVFVVHSDDSQCRRTDTDQYNSPTSLIRTKQVSFVIHEKITDYEYLAAIFGTVGIFCSFYVFSFIVSCAYFCRSTPYEFPIEDSNTGDSFPDQSQSPTGQEQESEESETCPIVHEQQGPTLSQRNIRNRGIQNPDLDNTVSTSQWLVDSDSSLDETDIDMLEDANRDKDVFRTTTILCVAALARKNPRVLAKKSQLYLWTLLTVAVFYALPVVQLVFTYQKVLHTTGNEDLCYYNYLCSHPLWVLSDFNHVYSNIGYLLLGFLFLLLVLRKEKMHHTLASQNCSMELNFGIPCHFGLFYAMGFALIMEGILSACYHVCPNHSNFQFDTCFMYVNAILCMLKIYQTRHPDINASAYMAFGCLAVVVLLGVLGVLAGSLYFWIIFTTLHVGTCLFLSVQIYYLGRWRLNVGVFKRIYLLWKNDCLASPLQCLRPLYVDRMILLIIANSANWAIAAYGIYMMSHDFASHLLLIFMSNLLLYTLFYIVMKLTHRERILYPAFIYIIMSVVFWGLSMYLFLQRSTSWQLSPAESRTFNKECLLLRFYDTHDIWHFLSAAAMFFSFMVLLTLDDDLIKTPRTKIPVF